LPKIKENYVDTGKVRIVYKDFPLTRLHPNAQIAAEAAECADAQGRFWDYHDKLFNNQDEWASAGRSKLKEYASELGLDTQRFNQCLDSGKFTQEVKNDLQDGRSRGVSGTPTFFINGQKVVGAQPYSVFKQRFESILA
ncbi:MAG: DsbA family protein, partial [Candidatus Aenigmatarchaeota archaeon]